MPRKKKIVAAVFILFVALFVGLSYLDAYLARVVKATLERKTLAQTGLELDLGVVEVKTLWGDLLAMGPRVIDPARAKTLARAQRLAVDADPWSLIGDVATVNSVDLWKLETVIDIDAEGVPKLPTPPALPTPSPQQPGLRIDKIDVYVEEFVVRHELAQGGTVGWRIHPADLVAEGVRLPCAPGSQITVSFSARLLEPSTGTVKGNIVFIRREGQWEISGRKDVQIARAAALNPYLPPDFPLVASSGAVSVRNDVLLHGTILEATVTIALSQPRFEPREKRLASLFAGEMSQFAIRAIRDATGDITLDPIYIRGDLRDPKSDLRGQFLTDLRSQILHRIFQRATSIPSGIARQLRDTIGSLPPAAVLDRADRVAGEVLNAGAGLAGKGKKVGKAAAEVGKKVGGTATEAAKGVGSQVRKLLKRDK